MHDCVPRRRRHRWVVRCCVVLIAAAAFISFLFCSCVPSSFFLPLFISCVCRFGLDSLIRARLFDFFLPQFNSLMCSLFSFVQCHFSDVCALHAIWVEIERWKRWHCIVWLLFCGRLDFAQFFFVFVALRFAWFCRPVFRFVWRNTLRKIGIKPSTSAAVTAHISAIVLLCAFPFRLI